MRGAWLLVFVLSCARPFTSPPLAESDAPLLHEIALEDGLLAVQSVKESGDRLYVVDAEGVLARVEGATRIPICDRARGEPALLADALVITRDGDEPGETDLWWYPTRGLPAPLAPAPGPDELPLALPDGRIVFLSGRSTIASWWLVDPREGEPTQLTNRGQRAGAIEGTLVPSPAGRARVEKGRVLYEDGEGHTLALDPERGTVEVEP